MTKNNVIWFRTSEDGSRIQPTPGWYSQRQRDGILLSGWHGVSDYKIRISKGFIEYLEWTPELSHTQFTTLEIVFFLTESNGQKKKLNNEMYNLYGWESSTSESTGTA